MEAQEKESDEEDDYVPYISVRDRKRAVLEKHGNRLGILKQEAAAEKYESSSGVESEGEVRSEAEDNVMSGPATGRSLLDQHSELKKKEEGKLQNIPSIMILMVAHLGLAFLLLIVLPHYTESKETAIEKQLKEEEKILESVADKTALKGVAELAKGIEYTDPIKTG